MTPAGKAALFRAGARERIARGFTLLEDVVLRGGEGQAGRYIHSPLKSPSDPCG